MRRIPKTWPIILIASLSTVLAWQVWENREPFWHDRSASYWFEQLYVSTNAVKALGAFHAMGADAVPLLKSRLEEPETPWRSLYAKYWPILPTGIQTKLTAPRPLIEQKIAAAHALAEIGAAGKAAVPALLAILDKPPIDPPAKPRVPGATNSSAIRRSATPPAVPTGFSPSFTLFVTNRPAGIISSINQIVINPANSPSSSGSGASNRIVFTPIGTNNQTVSYAVAFSGAIGVGAVMAPSIDLLEYSIRALESIGDCDRKVYASLLHLMRHSNPDIKNASRYAILGMVRNHHASAPELIGALRDWRYVPEKNESPALEVATRLAAECVRSVPEMVPVLMDAIGSKDSNLKAIAARGLGETRQPSRDVVTALFQATVETNNNVRAIAIASLKPLCRHNDDALASCNSALDNPNYLIRAAAADILREVDIGVLEPRAPTCLPKLRELLADPEREVRYQSALTLWWVAGDGKPIADIRIADLSSHDQLARLDAVDFLGRLDADAERAIPGLIETLSHDTSDEVRIHAATALGNIGQKARLALPALIIAFDDPRESVRASALGAISRIDPAAAHRLESR